MLDNLAKLLACWKAVWLPNCSWFLHRCVAVFPDTSSDFGEYNAIITIRNAGQNHKSKTGIILWGLDKATSAILKCKLNSDPESVVVYFSVINKETVIKSMVYVKTVDLQYVIILALAHETCELVSQCDAMHW